MNHNYHKRLSNYMSEPRLNYRQSSPDNAYINAVKSKYITNDRHINFGMNPNFYPSVTNQPMIHCQQCNMDKNRASKACAHFRTQEYKEVRKGGGASNQYFGPEIKTIRNTLLDIRDQMKSRNNKKQIGRVSHREEEQDPTYENWQSQYIKVKQIELKRKIQQSERLRKQLQIKVDELEHRLADYQRKNRILEDDKNFLQKKIIEFQKEVQEQRIRANRIESQKNKSDERQRGFQIKVMEMRAELMRKQQLIRDLNFEGDQQKHMQATKRLMMGPSEQVSVLVNYGISQVKQSKGVQTVLTEVDIETGYRQLNKMQDHLCDRINGNLKVEKKIFAHLEDLDERLNLAYERIHRVQQQGLKMGIVIQK